MGEASVYKNIVRTGWVSSVNAADRTARVTFKDMGTTFVSGPLKVIQNPPFIPAKDVVQETQTESGGSGDASFASHTHNVKISPCYRRRVTMCFVFISRRTTATGS